MSHSENAVARGFTKVNHFTAWKARQFTAATPCVRTARNHLFWQA
jgi:hypothetical protein